MTTGSTGSGDMTQLDTVRESLIATLFAEANKADDTHADLMRQAAEALASHSTQAQQWRPIETAPKDGTYVLVWPPTWNDATSCARWDKDGHSKKPRPFWRRLDDFGRRSVSRARQSTHWMPLPTDPGSALLPSPPAVSEREKELEEALRKIAAIPNKMTGQDWDEIEEARQIANGSLLQRNGDPTK